MRYARSIRRGLSVTSSSAFRESRGRWHAHAALDRAVWAAYGWDDPDPATVDDDTILARLLALNLERSGRAP